MAALPTGTVTFLFTDIEGSTLLVREQGAAWPALLARHGEIMRAAIERHGGVEVGTEGDSFFVAFTSAGAAVATAVEAQRALAAESWPTGVQIRVRMGMHTGEASFSAESYAGLHVHRASRVAGVAHGGQVLLSDATHVLLGDDDVPGTSVRDLGEHRLKDLEHPEHLWQLVIDGLPSEFPPLRSIGAIPNNLPSRLTSFLGREAEIGEMSDLLARTRILTLTGPGGTGKTSISLAVAERLMPRYPGGVFFVELASITDPDLVLPTIATTLNLPDRGGRNSLERIADHVGDRTTLLVLDNFEQVVAAAGEVGRLVAACPGLTVIVSSRIVLRIAGEQEYPVPPLRLPDPAHLPPLAQLSQYESVALFIDRARAVNPAFEVTNETAPAVAEICVRLDGLPLAIELAAARIRILPPAAMLARLDDRLRLVAGGARDLPERQQTLRGAIAWSHDLLDEPERAQFATLSAFVGGASLEAIERISADEVDGDVLDLVTSLVEKSLLRQRVSADGQPRFAMLETIREFAAEQAAERGSDGRLRQRHAAIFAELVDEETTDLLGADARPSLDRLEEEHDNLRAAITWATEAGDAATALRMTARLWRFWQMRGYLAEGAERVERALGLPSSHDHPEARADALSAAAGLAYWQADALRSRQWYAEEVDARRALGDRAGLAAALYGLSFSWAILDLGRDENAAMALAAIDEAQAIFTEIGDPDGVGRCEWARANVEYGLGDGQAALEHAIHSRDVFRSAGNEFMASWASFTIALGELLLEQDPGGEDPGRRERAAAALRESLMTFAAAQDVSGYTLVIDTFSIIAHRNGDEDRAARLAGAVATLERATGTGLNLWNRSVLDKTPDYATDAQWADAFSAGAALSIEEAVALAMEA